MKENVYKLLSKDIDKTYGLLDEAIYYYLKLKEIINSKKNVTDKNSKKLIQIYKDLLDKLNIDNKIIEDNNILKLEYNINEYNILLTTKDINNLICISSNNITKNKFYEKLNYIKKDMYNKKQLKEIFNKNIELYKNKYLKDSISHDKRLKVLIKRLSSNSLRGIDSLNYIKHITKNIINDDNIKLDIYYKKYNDSDILRPIFIINSDSKYILVDNNTEEIIKLISKKEIDGLIKNNILLKEYL